MRKEFKAIGLEDIEPATMEALCLDDIEQLRVHFGKAYNRCQAARKNPAGVLNAVQCSGSCRKHFSYCWRHSIQDEAYKIGRHKVQVVKFEEASTSETLSSSACSSLDGVKALASWSGNA